MARSHEDHVRRRAQGRCEYCRIPQECDPLPFQIDHIIARQHGGSSSLNNLAWTCLACNNHKGPNVAGLDPEGSTDDVVRLYRPREDVWEDHFEWDGVILKGTTAVGRVTVYVLSINLSYRVALRKALIEEGRFP